MTHIDAIWIGQQALPGRATEQSQVASGESMKLWSTPELSVASVEPVTSVSAGGPPAVVTGASRWKVAAVIEKARTSVRPKARNMVGTGPRIMGVTGRLWPLRCRPWRLR
jgi:hypothetical protein